METGPFTKEDRLLKRRDFLALLHAQHRIHSRRFLIVWGEAKTSRPRIGITVSRKVGNSVVRNRFKRLLREYYRHRKNLPPADYNFIVKKGVSAPTFTELCDELDRALAPLTRSRC